MRVHDTLGARGKNRTFSFGRQMLRIISMMAMILYRHLHWPHFTVRATPGRFEKVQPKYFCLKIESTPNSFAFFLILPPFERRLPHRKEKRKTTTKFRILYFC